VLVVLLLTFWAHFDQAKRNECVPSAVTLPSLAPGSHALRLSGGGKLQHFPADEKATAADKLNLTGDRNPRGIPCVIFVVCF